MMRILIVDDDMSSAKALADKLAQYEDTELIGMAHTGVDGLRMYRESSPDLMFLDVELPDVSGLDFLACIDAVGMGNCRVVMYTAHSRYMLPAFRSRAFDYLVKPIDDAELRGIMRCCRNGCRRRFQRRTATLWRRQVYDLYQQQRLPHC